MNGITHITQALSGSPWSLPQHRAADQQPEAIPTKTERMRRYLREHGPANSHTLAMEADLSSSGLVGALLKNDLHKGSIFKRGDRYVWNPEWDQKVQAEIREAKALLRRHGYEVRRSA